MDKENFLQECRKEGYELSSLAEFEKAIDFAERELKDQKRKAGDTYFDHNLRVGFILVKNKSLPEVVVAGLLHGLLGEEQQKKIKFHFGQEVLDLIKEVEEVKRIKDRNEKIEAEALRKILLTTVKDVRVILIKLANKLDNLRSAGVHSGKDQERIAREVMEIYAPLAYRLGLERIKIYLEDLAFKILNPQKYQEIATFLEESEEEREKDIAEAMVLVKKTVGEKVSILKIKGRPKHIYSIYRKIEQKKLTFKDLYDLLGLRIIVPEVKDCYTLLGLLHEDFKPIEGRLKDYIANPKANLYRSLHTGVRLPGGKIAEIQIRTPEMDEIAEEGIAAHWRYKGLVSEQIFEKKIAWLRGILELQQEGKEFLEAAKIDVFGDNVYCYTPKGELKELPTGASILDFAYSVHGEVGDKAVGGRVNGKFVPLRHELKQGDVVEVLTNRSQRPRRTWLKIVKSSKAKQKIRKSLKEYEKLPPLHYHVFRPSLEEEAGILVESEEFPKAACFLAKCCYPLPGEEIVGITTKRRIISVHRDDCKDALKLEERWVPVAWKNGFSHKIKFFVRAEERSGLLADLLHTIAHAGFEVKEAKAKLIDLSNALCSFLVVPKDLSHLKELVSRIKKVKGIKKIYFE